MKANFCLSTLAAIGLLAVKTVEYKYPVASKTLYGKALNAQSMNYPNSFKNASPTEYERALSLMGMSNENTVTPLWWAKK